MILFHLLLAENGPTRLGVFIENIGDLESTLFESRDRPGKNQSFSFAPGRMKNDLKICQNKIPAVRA